jgi:hypothetical protein
MAYYVAAKRKYVAPQPVVNNIAPQPVINTVAPPQQPQVANQVTIDPLQPVVNTVAPPQQPQVANQVTIDPLQPVVNTVASQPVVNTVAPSQQSQVTKPSLFSNTAPGIGDAYASTLRDSLTGKIYDPFAAGQKEAMARAEANKRATTANQITGAGFTGQGIGRQIAVGAEGDISKNRFATLNGIEQARNEGRVAALGEARAYGTAEEGIRQTQQNFGETQRQFDTGQGNWEKNFGEGQRQFNTQTGQWEKNFGEGQRQFNTQTGQWEKNFGETQRQFDTGQSNWQKNFDQEKTRYKDSQAWTAYEQALVTGSDADVIAAYKAATGKDLDPMAVSQYRGYYRSAQEQGLAAGNVAIKTAQTTLDTMKRTDAGTALSSYLTTHLDANVSDPAIATQLQKYWESLGNTGVMPKDWADQQVKAARDVRLNTEAGKFNYDVDQQVAAGVYTSEQGELLKGFNSSNLTQFLVKDPVTGAVKFDTAAYLKSVNGAGTTTGTIAGQGGITVKIPVDTNGKPTVNNGGYFYGEDNNLYTVEDGEPVSANLSDVLASKDWNKITALYKSNPEKVAAEVPAVTARAASNQPLGSILKMPNGAVAKVTGSSKVSNGNYTLILTTTDGKKVELRPVTGWNSSELRQMYMEDLSGKMVLVQDFKN